MARGALRAFGIGTGALTELWNVGFPHLVDLEARGGMRGRRHAAARLEILGHATDGIRDAEHPAVIRPGGETGRCYRGPRFPCLSAKSM